MNEGWDANGSPTREVDSLGGAKELLAQAREHATSCECPVCLRAFNLGLAQMRERVRKGRYDRSGKWRPRRPEETK